MLQAEGAQCGVRRAEDMWPREPGTHGEPAAIIQTILGQKDNRILPTAPQVRDLHE